MPTARFLGMANQTKQKGAGPDRPGAAQDHGEATEWPHNPPLPSRDEDPDGEGDALRSVAAPGDDLVFAANADEEEEKAKKQKKAKDAEAATQPRER
jgi:hypothetical protein